ncbi:MAG: hypothetical protein J7499_12210 [Sphingopyxis sp.]|nr:hypothetical protein [Sphingopyxis sp.]
MSDWYAAATFYRGRITADPAFDVLGDMFANRRAWNLLGNRPNSWPELMKIIRHVFGIPIDEAQRLILSHAGFRKLVQTAIDTNPDCAEYARRGIRRGSMQEIVELQGDRPVISLTWRSAALRI